MTVVVISIDRRSAAFGERPDQARSALHGILQAAALDIGAHGHACQTKLKDANGEVVGSVTWGGDAISGS
jgi:hypothetical protein